MCCSNLVLGLRFLGFFVGFRSFLSFLYENGTLLIIGFGVEFIYRDLVVFGINLVTEEIVVVVRRCERFLVGVRGSL